MTEIQKLDAVGAFYRRIHDLQEDGYYTLFAYAEAGLYFYKLVHRNGNRVSVRLSLKDGRLSQFKNGKECYSAKMC